MIILVIAPHPDDEALGCGGYIAKRVNAGDTAYTLFLTSGEHGIPGIGTQDTMGIRELEAQKASEILGSEIVGFWRLPDGKLAYSESTRDRLIELLIRLEVDEVLVTHEREAHPDHRAAGRIVREAVREMDPRPSVLTYEVWTPQTVVQRVVDVTDFMSSKMEAIRQHVSQVSRISFDRAAEALAAYRGTLHGRSKYSEVFNRMRLNGEEGMRIGIALLTYAPSLDHPRSKYAKITLESTLSNLSPGLGNEFHVHIADDGSAPEHVDMLKKIAKSHGYEPSMTNAERGGYGKSYNLMMQALHSSCDLILPLEDDWELAKPLDLDGPAKVLADSKGEIRSVRLGYLGITQDLIGTVVFRSGQTYLLLDPDSPEPHVFCGHPRLETTEYERDIGAWPEGIGAGDTEWEVTHRRAARIGVAWPLDLGIPASQDWGATYCHIGSESVGQLIPTQ